VIDLSHQLSQTAFGELVGISQQAVSDLIARGVLAVGSSGGAWLLAYCSHIREIAAGRATNGDLDLATERARLAREQADKVAMQNAVMRREYAPVATLAHSVARTGRQIAVILEAIPVQLKRRSSISIEDLEYITTDIVKARNLAANMRLDLDNEEPSALDDMPDDMEDAA
jgi:terminase small subunit / prophage DNA-packing protein